MAKAIRIDGVEDVLRMFDGAPKELQKAGKKAMASAGRKVAAKLKRQIPSRWKKLIKSKAKMSRDGNFWAVMGLYNGHEAQGHQPDGKKVSDWFKAYWADYGTLERRDPNHKFDSPVKSKDSASGRLRRNDMGQFPERFFEAASGGWETVFISEFKGSLKKQGYDLDRI
nr:MAG TPA: hypothetical protein [Caudoviricetes sp.]